MTLSDKTPSVNQNLSSQSDQPLATQEQPADSSSMQSLEQINLLVRNCPDCPLSSSHTNSVPGEGNPQADVMFIGEGPGYYEDLHGRPFVGRAGKLLDRLLGSINLIREDVFIANMVKCRPPGNCDSGTADIAACTKYLDRQIELINPKLIVTLGRFALGWYFPGEGITKARGKLREKDGRMIFPVLHPAAVLRREELRATMIEDFKAIAEILEGATKDTGMERGETTPDAPQTDQLSFVDEPGVKDPSIDDPGHSAAATEPAEVSTVNVEEVSQPEQLALF
jgi:uracil-DNA glycosylase family 4